MSPMENRNPDGNPEEYVQIDLETGELIPEGAALYEIDGVVCGVRVYEAESGTGAALSYMGLPCPNLSTGGYNFHGRKELIPVPALEKMVDVLVSLVS